MTIARKLHVIGRVQGVFYRAWTQQQASELGLSGWVRNLADGSVEAQVEGDEDAVRALVERMQDGPPHAEVEDIRIEPSEMEGAAGFQIRH